MKRVVLSQTVVTCLNLMDDYSDEHDLLDCLIKYGRGEDVSFEYDNKIKTAFEYLTHPQRIDQVYIDDTEIFH